MPCFGSEHVKFSLPVSSFVHSELLSFIFDCSIQAATQLMPSPNKKHEASKYVYAHLNYRKGNAV